MIRHFHSCGPVLINRSHGLAPGMLGAWMATPQHQGMNVIPDGIGHHPGEASGGVSYYASQYGVVPAFDASNDVISMGIVADMAGMTKATLAGAIYRSATSVSAAIAGANGTSAGTTGARFGFLWFTDANIYFECNSSSLAYGFCGLTGTGWHHVMMVYDGSQATNATKLVAYIDGVAQTLSFFGTIPASLAINPFNPFVWGKDSSNRFAGGSVHHSILWDRILTAADAVALNNEFLSGFPTLINHPKPWAWRRSGGTANTQNLTGSLTPTGAITKAAAKPLTGSPALSGSTTKAISVNRVGALLGTGLLTKAGAKPLTGAVTPSGSVTQAAAKPLTGGASLGGSVTQAAAKPLTGSLSPAASLAQQVLKNMTGALAAAGTLTKLVAQLFTGSLSLAGTLAGTGAAVAAFYFRKYILGRRG